MTFLTPGFNPEAASFIPGAARHLTPSDTEEIFSFFHTINAHQRGIGNRTAAEQALEEFKLYFGKDPTDLYAWQKLCWTCGVEQWDVPATIPGCKAVLRNTFVNIFDLLVAARNGGRAYTWPNAEELARYSRIEGKICPAAVAGGNVLFRFMLRRWY